MLANSVIRIVKREPDDPHGASGYFLHEIHINQDGEIRSWKAYMGLGASTPGLLIDHFKRVAEAFRFPVILYKDLATKGFKISTESTLPEIKIDIPVPEMLGQKHTFKNMIDDHYDQRKG